MKLFNTPMPSNDHRGLSLVSLMKLVSSSQVVFGTDFPFLTAKATAAELRETGLFSVTDLQAIERGNAERLMPKYRI